jgi:hypothetical protein
MPSHEMEETLIERIARNTPGTLAGLAVIAAIAAFTLQPLLRFADPVALSSGTLALFAGATQCRSAATESSNGWLKHAGFWIGVGLLLTGLAVLGSALFKAQADASANDARCAVIQHEMLVAKPRRGDLSDLFVALGCRPQGTAGAISFPLPEAGPINEQRKRE